MNPRVTIEVRGLQGSVEDARRELESATGGSVTAYDTTRGSVGDAINFIAELSGSVSQVAERLINLAKTTLAGSEITVKAQGMEINLTNVPRDQLVEILRMVMDAAKQ